MNSPLKGDYIDIHTHDSIDVSGVFAIENIMAHEQRYPSDMPFRACTCGIHPWHLGEGELDRLLVNVRKASLSPNLVAIGEAGFDKLRGPDLKIQTKAFEEQVRISEEIAKPLFIHCVRAWDDLLPVFKRLRPSMPWLIHGFRGKPELALQLIAKGMYLSFWFDFVVRPESSALLRSLPRERFFFETDGAGVNIQDIYKKVANDLGIDIDELKAIIYANYLRFFNLKH